MPDLSGAIIVTTVGRNALLGGSFAPAEMGLGTATWSPTETSTALDTEVARVDVAGVLEQVGDDARLHLTALDDSALDYALREFALFDADGLCLAIYSQATDIAVKATASSLLLSIDVLILDADVEDIELADTTYNLPAATEEASGLVERATQAEVNTGTDTARFITPATLAGRTATSVRTGLARLATGAEVLAGTVADAIVTPLTLLSRVASTAIAGLVELATVGETIAGSDTTRAVTPAGLAAMIADSTFRGLVELATSAEAQAGTDSLRAVTPAAMASVTATTTRRGLVELATSAEATAGTDVDRATTPAGVAAVAALLKPRVNNRSSTVLFSPEETKTEVTFTGLVPNAPYLVQVVGVGNHNGSGGANLELVGVTGSRSTIDTSSSPFALQGRLVANGSGQLAIQLRNDESTKTISTQWCNASAQLCT